jgi:uncharacterized protein (TIGR04206 family)
MRVWVRSEYAPELAVAFAWLSAFIPWTVSYATLPDLGSVAFVRFPLFQVRYAFGIPFAEAVKVDSALAAWQFQAGQSIEAAYAAWLAGAAVLLATLALSAAMYVDLDRVAPYRPVAVMGWLLGVAGGVFAVATYLLATRGFPSMVVPVGVVFLFAFALVLLTADRA